MRKILTSLFCACYLLFTVHIAYASTSTPSWNVGSAVAQGATTVYTATKEIGGKLVTSVAKITPTPAQIAKGLGKGLFAGLALSVAQKLIEDGVDFVMDPANNELRYTKKPDGKAKTSPQAYYSTNAQVGYYSTADATCNAVLAYYKQKSSDYDSSSLSGDTCYLYDKSKKLINLNTLGYGPNPNYDPKAKDDSKQTIPFTQLASSIIGEANNNDEDAKSITSAVAQSATASNTDDQLVPYTQLTQALDASVPTSQDDTKSPPATNTGSQSQTQDQAQDQSKPDESASNPTATPTPNTPSVPTDCQFFQTACTWFDWTKKQYTDAVDAVKDFSKDDIEDKDNKDKVDDDSSIPKTIATDTFKFNGMCPADIVTQIPDPMGGSNPLTLSFTNFCTWLQRLNPWTDVLGWIVAISIISGQRSSNSE